MPRSTTLQGRGKRITLRDSTEKVLADIVIGNEVKGTDRKDGSTQKYVRVPTQKRIYGVNIKAEPSTRFADWIETNLLKVETSHIRKIVFDNYKIQEDPNRAGPAYAAARREVHDHAEGRQWPVDDGRPAAGPRAGRRQAPHAE